MAHGTEGVWIPGRALVNRSVGRSVDQDPQHGARYRGCMDSWARSGQSVSRSIGRPGSPTWRTVPRVYGFLGALWSIGQSVDRSTRIPNMAHGTEGVWIPGRALVNRSVGRSV